MMPETDDLLVRDIMVRDPVTVLPTTSVWDVACLMGDRNIGAVVVATEGCVAGIFTERDLLRRAVESRDDWAQTPVACFMTSNPVLTEPDVVWEEATAVMDQRSIRHLPVVEAGRLVGMLTIRDVLRHRTSLLETIVRDRTAALAARNAALTGRDQMMTRNLKLAAKVQKRLLSGKLPSIEPFRFAAISRGHDQVTGDYHDLITLGPDRIGVLIGDVSGHGVPAALVSVMVKMCCTAYCQDLDSPSAILRTMNEQLGDLIEGDHFISMFAAVADRRNQKLTYACAGHPLPLWFRAASGEVTALAGTGMMIGIVAEPDFEDRHILLESGDKVLFFTDGVSECRNARGDFFGIGSLHSFLGREGHRPCQEILTQLESTISRFRGDRPFDDDVTILVLEAT